MNFFLWRLRMFYVMRKETQWFTWSGWNYTSAFWEEFQQGSSPSEAFAQDTERLKKRKAA